MSSLWATSCASAMESSEQQGRSGTASPLQNSFIVAPMTSYPASTSNAAATDESTPPDIATRTRSLTAPLRNYRASSMQYRGQLPNLVNDLRQCTDDRIHVLRHAVLPERKAQRRHAELARHAHRAEHVRRLHRPGAAGRPRRAGNAGEVEMHEQSFGVGPGDRDVGDVGRALGPRTVDQGVGQDVEQPPLQLVAQRAHRGGERRLLAGRELHRPPQSDDPRHVLRARPQPELLPTAVDDRFDGVPVAYEQRADPLGSADLVAGNGDESTADVLERDRDLAERLNGVRVEGDLRLATSRGDPGDRLNRHDLVVDPHDAHDRYTGREGPLDRRLFHHP